VEEPGTLPLTRNATGAVPFDLEGEARDCGAGATIGVQTHVAGLRYVTFMPCVYTVTSALFVTRIL
jgi:hypothetical protein